jgi:hypothetical protein
MIPLIPQIQIAVQKRIKHFAQRRCKKSKKRGGKGRCKVKRGKAR